MNNNLHAFSGRAVLVTGCSSGIGNAIAQHLARNGFTVFATVRRNEDAERLRRLDIPQLLPMFPLDLTRRADVPPLIEQVEDELRRRELGGLYALVHNAGGGSVAPLECIDLDAFETELRARLVGALALTQAALPLLRRGGGRVVWITTPAIVPTPYVGSIHVCDFAVNCLARTLDIELKPWNIRSIQVRCGGIRTAKGLETTRQVEAALTHPNGGLYRAALERWAGEMAEFDRRRTPPERVAQVVLTALRATRPRRRYAVGYMSRAAAFLESLPQPLADAILNRRF